MLGPYRTGRRLGGGGMGVVLEALDTVLNRRVALKVIAPDLAGDPDFRARFTREAQAQASLDSPHVVHVYGHGEDDGRLWIATQLIPDGDLGAMIRAYGAPPARTGLDLVAQVASGLADAHAAGLIHRDIKPANVLLRRRPEGLTAYLGDFGIARRVGAEQTHATTGTVGTPTFMAPELHTGSPATPASDVYSLGCLLWVTLTGRAPYAGTSDYQVVAAHLGEPVPQLAADSPLAVAVNRILRSAMAKRPEDRHPSAAAVRDDLRAALALPDAPVVAEPPPTPPGPAVDVPPRPTRRRLALVVAAAALLVVAALGSAWVFTRGGDGSPTAGDRTPTATPTPTPAEPASPTGTPATTAADEERAIASLAEALEAQGLMTAEQARCAARRWIQEAGLQAMVDAGFFDEDLQYVDRPQSELTPALQAAALSAVTACVAL
jgi:serine/threonine-protein kinase